MGRTRNEGALLLLVSLTVLSWLILAFSPVAIVQSPSGVRLEASIDRQTYSYNQTVQVTLAERNLLPVSNTPPLADGWRLANASFGPCGQGQGPYGVVLFNGTVTNENFTAGREVALVPPQPYDCLDVELTPGPSGFRFGPFEAVSDVLDLPGYYTAGFTEHPGGGESAGLLHPLPQGAYTLVVGDTWGRLVFLGFSVSYHIRG